MPTSNSSTPRFFSGLFANGTATYVQDSESKYPILCEALGGAGLAERRARADLIADVGTAAIEHPWSGGPDVVEARGEVILVRRGGILTPAEWRGGRSWSYVGTPLVFVGAAGDVPTGWRWHPPAPEREG